MADTFLYILPFVLVLSDCLLITDNKEDESSCDVITVRLQGKEKGSAKEYSLHKVSEIPDIFIYLFIGVLF